MDTESLEEYVDTHGLLAAGLVLVFAILLFLFLRNKKAPSVTPSNTETPGANVGVANAVPEYIPYQQTEETINITRNSNNNNNNPINTTNVGPVQQPLPEPMPVPLPTPQPPKPPTLTFPVGVSVPTVTQAAQQAAQPQSRTYVVQGGDTLSGIGAKLGVAWNSIFSANQSNLDNTARQHGFANSGGGHWIFPGEVLTIPSN